MRLDFRANQSRRIQSARPDLAPSLCKVDEILAQFNTWAFKREQPSDIGLLRRIVEKRSTQSLPINFVVYWGKGPRNTAAKPDEDCLDFLALMMRRIASTYPSGASITLIQTDTHARLNGHDEHSILRYFQSVAALASERGMSCVSLSAIVAADAGRSPPDAPRRIDDGDLLQLLVRSAVRWYRGPGEAEAGARRYFEMNMVERDAVGRFAPDSIFVTFNGSAMRGLFPAELPIFYMYSMRRGYSVKPWFVSADGSPIEGAA